MIMFLEIMAREKRLKLIAYCSLLVFVWFVCSCNASAGEREIDKQSLLDFKKLVTADPLKVLSTWDLNSNISHCNWTAITCSKSGTVENISLYSMELQGTISPSLGNLSHLKKLDLFNNSFHGTIPPQLGLLRRLEILFLSANQLEGTIPSTFTSLTKLQTLSLAENNLHGSLPQDIGKLSSLVTAQLQTTNLSGSLPPSIGNLSSLQSLFLYECKFEGQIPAEIGMLKNLQSFMLFENPAITGPIPASLSNISGLIEMDLHSNSLTGEIPEEFGELKQLNVLYLWGNKLRGTIPASLANCSQLVKLDLDKNQLSGSVPLEFEKLRNLQIFSVAQNNLVSDNSGSVAILSAFSSSLSLDVIDMSHNKLTGSLPDKLPRNISEFYMYNNILSGPIPWEAIAEMKSLWNIDLSHNVLTGGISKSVSRLEKLQKLSLGYNRLQGEIPSEIGGLQHLSELSLPHNFISGQITESIGNLKQLRRLVLHDNKLSGSIPPSLGNCNVLELLDVSSNELNGSIPLQVANLQNIQFYFNLSRNSLEGRLPPEVGEMIHVLAIDVSQNRLVNVIPASISNCEQLQILNLSMNAFNGTIPDSLDQLKSLVSMDLSHNNLSGPIPTALGNLQNLQSLNVSFNYLSGPVPQKGVFQTMKENAFKGNQLLCGNWLGLPSCKHNVKKHSHASIKVIVAVIVVSSAVVACIFVLMLMILHRKCRTKNESLMSRSKYYFRKMMSNNLLSYAEISEATNSFSRENLLGSSTFGSVYKGILSDGTLAAIKILNPDSLHAVKTFYAEMKVLSEVKHRNLVKIKGFCTEGKCRAVVMDLMPNGSLDQALTRGLVNFKRMLDIALDVANALKYLHQYCHVHCDIKPSNILLDENSVGHVGDIGISRLLIASNSSDSLFSTLALKGSSIGYIPPEYGAAAMVSTKGDVYSYGVMLLEMITGRHPSDERLNTEETSIISWVCNSFPDKLMNIMDTRVMEEVKEDEYLWQCVIAFTKVGLACTKQNPSQRPSMKEVVILLKAIVE